jgi:hypothetical protein
MFATASLKSSSSETWVCKICGQGSLIDINIHLEKVPEFQTADPETTVDVTGPLKEDYDATYATLNVASDEVDSREEGSSEDGSSEGGGSEEGNNEDDIDSDDVDEDISNEDDWDDGLSDDTFLDPIHFTQAARGNRAAQRGLHYSEDSDLPRQTRPHVKRKRLVCSESRSTSMERPSTRRPRPAALTNTDTSKNTSTDRAPTLARTPSPANPRNTPQATPSETTRLTPASEAGATGTLQEAPHEVHREVPRERALAKRQLELSKAMNRAAELEAHNRINEIKQEIEFETKVGDVLGD